MSGAAMRRLRRDYEELQSDPVDGCAAYPISDDLLEWHLDVCPLEAPLRGVRLHMVLRFPRDYPKSPPTLDFPRREYPSFHHPNLYDFGSAWTSCRITSAA